MIRLFKNSRAISFILIPIFILSYYILNEFFKLYTIQTYIDLGGWGRLTNFSYSSLVLAGCFVFMNAMYINYIFNKNEFLDKNYYIPGLVYTIYMSFFHSFFSLDGLLIAHTFIIALIHQIYLLHQNTDARKTVFNAGILGGLAACFHPPLIVIFPIICFMIWVIRPFVLREFFLTLTGFIVPIIYAFLFKIYHGYQIELKLLDQYVNYKQNQIDFLVTAIIFVLLFLISLSSLRLRMLKSSIRIKKLIRIQWMLIVIALAIGLLDIILYQQFERFSFILIPLAFFATFSFWSQTFETLAKILFYLSFLYSFVKFFI
jgi:hypothetical protein